ETNDKTYICTDNTTGTAVWNQLSGVYSSIVIAEDGTIGIAAGPLLTFDGSGTILKLTGAFWETHDKGNRIYNNLNTSGSSALFFRKNRAGATVQDGDELGYVDWYGWDGDEYSRAALIIANVDGAPADGKVPGRIELRTRKVGGSSAITRVTIDNNGDVTFTGDLILSALKTVDGRDVSVDGATLDAMHTNANHILAQQVFS
ncbi:hypothetical protein, partial [Candidatus Magnetobacterium casense]